MHDTDWGCCHLMGTCLGWMSNLTNTQGRWVVLGVSWELGWGTCQHGGQIPRGSHPESECSGSEEADPPGLQT